MTAKLRDYLVEQLKLTCPRVYNMEADNDAIFPYLTYDLIGFSEKIKTTYQFEVDVWDRQESTETVEGIVKDLSYLLSNTIYREDDQLIFIYYPGYKTVRDDDKLIKRRTLTFELTNYKLKGEI